MNRRQVDLQPIYDKLGPERALAIPGCHAITGSDTTCQTSGVGKKGALSVFMKASSDIISALVHLGIDEEPSEEVFGNVKSSTACC